MSGKIDRNEDEQTHVDEAFIGMLSFACSTVVGLVAFLLPPRVAR